MLHACCSSYYGCDIMLLDDFIIGGRVEVTNEKATLTGCSRDNNMAALIGIVIMSVIIVHNSILYIIMKKLIEKCSGIISSEKFD